MPRRNKGNETFERLLDWKSDQAASERLSAQILRIEGFKFLDPSHPLGGRDGAKDVVCFLEDKKWIGAFYFPRGQETFKAITKKFKDDFLGVARNNAVGFAFVTNQELNLSERKVLEAHAGNTPVQIYHLERVSTILNAPECYGIRLEFLDIEMTKDEQLAFIASREGRMDQLIQIIGMIGDKINSIKLVSTSSLENSIPLSELEQFKMLLDEITINPHFSSAYTSLPAWRNYGLVSDLRVPLSEMKEFVELLNRIAGNNSENIHRVHSAFGALSSAAHVNNLQIPLNALKEFEEILNRICGNSSSAMAHHNFGGHNSPISKLHVPLERLKEYELTLDRIADKSARVAVPKEFGPS